MSDLESRFRRATLLRSRADYKIFYCQIRPSPILTLGINPGGDPAKMNADGRTQIDGTVAAASDSFYENDEHDILDCHWRENTGLRTVLTPLVGGDVNQIRHRVVKTNVAFRRSASKRDIDIAAAVVESRPFLVEILHRVAPNLLLLTGVPLSATLEGFGDRATMVAKTEKDARINQTVFAAARVRLWDTGRDVTVVQIAHASQFGWTYARYRIGARILELLARFPRSKY